MSSSSNISDSLTKFGAGDGDTAVLVAAVGEEARLEEARQAVTGDWVQVGGESGKIFVRWTKNIWSPGGGWAGRAHGPRAADQAAQAEGGGAEGPDGGAVQQSSRQGRAVIQALSKLYLLFIADRCSQDLDRRSSNNPV